MLADRPMLTLEYATPPKRTIASPLDAFRLLFRLFCRGPLIGAVSGAVSTTTGTITWVWFGQPAFFFKGGWGGVASHLQMMVIMGAIAGFPFGLAVSQFELIARRRAPFWRLLASVVVLSLLIFAPMNFLQIRDRSLWAGIMPELTVAVLSLGLALVVSRPAE